MLTELRVEGVGVIERADMSLAGGCSALTGETGAGKTLIVAALGLLLGGRSDRALIREGAPHALVEGRFSLPPDHPVPARLLSEGLVDDSSEPRLEVEVVMSRTIAPDGRAGRARVNGHLVTVALLAELGESLVEIAGQHAYLRLGSRGRQRRLLDGFAGRSVQELAESVAVEVRGLVEAEGRLGALRAGEGERAGELDRLRSEVAEIEAAAPEEGESEALALGARRLEHAEALAEGLVEAAEALRRDDGAQELVADARLAVRRLTSADPALEGLALRLEQVSYELTDIAEELAVRLAPPEEGRLEHIQDRLALLGRLQRRYGADEAGMLTHLEQARRRIDVLGSVGEDAETLVREVEERRARATELAARLSEARREAGPRLARAVEETLGELALDGARVAVKLEPQALQETGAEAVELLVATDPGAAPRPVAKVASGGELSRIALALHLLTAGDSEATLVFDEVDAGVGGEAARAVGRLLARLAHRGSDQVIVITHLPQVAALADSHYLVTKEVIDGRARAIVEAIAGERRVGELSRMLAGFPDSSRAQDHAEELLALASKGEA